jgi:hypothetical protein
MKAKLVAPIPPERFHSLDGSAPHIGDIVTLDRGFTFPAVVACIAQSGETKWEAEVLESEVEVLP